LTKRGEGLGAENGAGRMRQLRESSEIRREVEKNLAKGGVLFQRNRGTGGVCGWKSQDVTPGSPMGRVRRDEKGGKGESGSKVCGDWEQVTRG